jgi:hypothetical protein
MSKVYLLSADTYEECFGCEITVFGIFTTKRKAQRMKAKLEKEYTYIFNIDEFNLDKLAEVYIGGFIE